MAAYITREYTKSCDHASQGCDATAEITEWSCGCVRVIIHGEDPACGHGCSDFSGMRRTCSIADEKGIYPDGSPTY